jgi:hypothetical protein
MNNNIDVKTIRNSLLFYLIRKYVPQPGYTYEDFRKDEDQIISNIKSILDGIDISIEEMLVEKENADETIINGIRDSLDEQFKDILKVKFRELYYRSFSKKLRKEILIRDKFKCQYCGSALSENVEDPFPPQIDHIKSWRSGGKTNPDNLVASCWMCNLGKKDYDLFEYDDDKTE